MSTIKYTAILLLLFTINACSSVMIIPQPGNISTIVAKTNNKERTTKIASSKAFHICQSQNKVLNIIDLKTIYQGAEPDQQDLINFAKTILPLNKTSGSYNTIGDYDYKSTLTFECV